MLSVCSYRNDVTAYNIRTGERKSLRDLPYGVEGHGCAIFNSAITISGGWTNYSGSDKVYQLQPSGWVKLPSLKKAR